MMDKVGSKSSLESQEACEPLLEDAISFPIKKKDPRSPISWKLISIYACAVYMIATTSILIHLAWNRMPQPYCQCPSRFPEKNAKNITAPVNQVVSYEYRPLYCGEDLKYTGLPEEVDEAWDILLERK